MGLAKTGSLAVGRRPVAVVLTTVPGTVAQDVTLYRPMAMTRRAAADVT